MTIAVLVNIAVFGAVGPMVGQQQSLRSMSRPLGWLMAGTLPVAALYGAIGS